MFSCQVQHSFKNQISALVNFANTLGCCLSMKSCCNHRYPLLFPSLSPYTGTSAYGEEVKHSVCVTNLCAVAHPAVEARSPPLGFTSAALVFETWSLSLNLMFLDSADLLASSQVWGISHLHCSALGPSPGTTPAFSAGAGDSELPCRQVTMPVRQAL